MRNPDKQFTHWLRSSPHSHSVRRHITFPLVVWHPFALFPLPSNDRRFSLGLRLLWLIRRRRRRRETVQAESVEMGSGSGCACLLSDGEVAAAENSSQRLNSPSACLRNELSFFLSKRLATPHTHMPDRRSNVSLAAGIDHLLPIIRFSFQKLLHFLPLLSLSSLSPPHPTPADLLLRPSHSFRFPGSDWSSHPLALRTKPTHTEHPVRDSALVSAGHGHGGDTWCPGTQTVCAEGVVCVNDVFPALPLVLLHLISFGAKFHELPANKTSL